MSEARTGAAERLEGERELVCVPGSPWLVAVVGRPRVQEHIAAVVEQSPGDRRAAAVRPREIGDRPAEHQAHRQQKHRDGEYRPRRRDPRIGFDVLRERNRPRRKKRHEQARIERPGERDRRHGNQQPETERQAERCMQRRDRDQRSGMRRHQRVQRGHPGQHRDRDREHRHPGARRRLGDDRHGDHETDLEEQRQPDQHRSASGEPGQRAWASASERRHHHLARGTGLLHHRAEQGAERDHEADRPQDAAGAGLERPHGLCRGHPRDGGEQRAPGRDRKERRQTQRRDQHDDQAECHHAGKTRIEACHAAHRTVRRARSVCAHQAAVITTVSTASVNQVTAYCR